MYLFCFHVGAGTGQTLSAAVVAGSVIGVIIFIIIIVAIGIFMVVMFFRICKKGKYGPNSVGYEIR